MSFGLGDVPLRPRDPMRAGDWLLVDAAVLANAVYFAERSRSRRDDGIAAVEDPQPSVTGPRLYDFACSLLERFSPTHALAAWDGPRNWRKKAPEAGGVAGYKAKRVEKPYGLRALLSVAPDVFLAAGIGSVRLEGHEADDVIASAAARAPGCVIVSNDKDFAQCLGDGVRWWNPMAKLRTETLDAVAADRGEWVTPESVYAKWGVQPHEFTVYQAICGDASDNVAGCPGIGAVGARSLVLSYGTLAGIYEAVESGKLGAAAFAARLLAGRESVYESLRAVTLATHLPVTAAPVGDRQEIDHAMFANPFKKPSVDGLNSATRSAMAPETAPAKAADVVVAEDLPKPESTDDKIRANARASVAMVIRNALACRQAPAVVLERATADAANYPASLAPAEDEILTMIREASRAQMEREQAPEGDRPARADAPKSEVAPEAPARPKAPREVIPDHPAIPERWRGHQRSQLQLQLAAQARNDLAVAAIAAGHARVPTGAPSMLRARLLDEIACLVEALTGALPWEPTERPAWARVGSLGVVAANEAPLPDPAEAAAPEASLEAAPQASEAPPETAAGDVAAQPVAERPRLLFIDCQPRGGDWVELSDFLAPVYRWVETERKAAHWLTLPFSEGPRLAAAGLAHGLRSGTLTLPERLVVRRSMPGASEALAELTPHYGRDAVVEASR